jgi:hypothetical protein
MGPPGYHNLATSRGGRVVRVGKGLYCRVRTRRTLTSTTGWPNGTSPVSSRDAKDSSAPRLGVLSSTGPVVVVPLGGPPRSPRCVSRPTRSRSSTLPAAPLRGPLRRLWPHRSDRKYHAPG